MHKDIFLPSFIAIPTAWQKRYIALRIGLYVLILAVTITFALRVLFPTLEQGFNFRTPSSSRNNIVDPRLMNGDLRDNGKIEPGETLIANTSVAGDFSQVRVSFNLEKDSDAPDNVQFSLRRSYRSFLYPTSSPLADFPTETIYHIGENYYALRNNVLSPFVSEKALASRYPINSSFILPATNEILNKYSVSEEWLGFRTGSLISNATGVFVVVSETEIRPIGSAEVFLALGYNFNDVIPASEEEIGIYKKGRIFLLGEAHPDGTLFLDEDTQTIFVIEQGTKRPLAGKYKDFLIEGKHPINASSSATEESIRCELLPSGLSGRSFTCRSPLNGLRDNPGNDYELMLSEIDASIDINALSVAFITDKNRQNMLTLLSQIKQRLFSRFGYGNTQ